MFNILNNTLIMDIIIISYHIDGVKETCSSMFCGVYDTAIDSNSERMEGGSQAEPCFAYFFL